VLLLPRGCEHVNRQRQTLELDEEEKRQARSERAACAPSGSRTTPISHLTLEGHDESASCLHLARWPLEPWRPFRNAYPEGDNYVVTADTDTPHSRRYKALAVDFVPLDDLISRLSAEPLSA
jgi:hypothetical protein